MLPSWEAETGKVAHFADLPIQEPAGFTQLLDSPGRNGFEI